VLEFLVAEKEWVRNMHKPLWSVYGSDTVDRSIVGCWAKGVMASKIGKAELRDLPCSGRCVTPLSPEMLQRADAIVCEDQRVKTKQLALSFLVSKGSVSHIIRDLGYLKVCVGGFFGVSQSNTTQRQAIFFRVVGIF
jgi:hypothetical protein